MPQANQFELDPERFAFIDEDQEQAQPAPVSSMVMEGLDPERFQFEEEKSPVEQERFVEEAGSQPQESIGLKDYAKILGKGLLEVPKSIATMKAATDPLAWMGKGLELIGAKTGSSGLMKVGEAVTGASPAVQTVETAHKLQENLQTSLSPEMKARQEKQFFEKGEDGKWKLGQAWTDPHKLGSMVVESAPISAVGMGGAVAVTKALMAQGTGKYTAGIIGGAISEGLTSGASNATDAYYQILGAPAAEMQQTPAYQEVYGSLSGDLPHADRDRMTRKVLALAGGALVGSTTAVTTGILGAPSGAVIGKMLGEGSEAVTKNFWKNIVSEALSEGFIEEGPQSTVETLMTNIAKRAYANTEQSLTEGMGEAAVGGVITGGLMGGGTATALQVGRGGKAKGIQRRPSETGEPIDLLEPSGTVDRTSPWTPAQQAADEQIRTIEEQEALANRPPVERVAQQRADQAMQGIPGQEIIARDTSKPIDLLDVAEVGPTVLPEEQAMWGMTAPRGLQREPEYGPKLGDIRQQERIDQQTEQDMAKFGPVRQTAMDRLRLGLSGAQGRFVPPPRSGGEMIESIPGQPQEEGLYATGLRELKPSAFQGGPNSLSVDAESPSDFRIRESALSQGYSGLDIPSRALVKKAMLPLLQDDKIFNSIVPFIPVDMVDMLAEKKFPPKDLLHNKSMFLDALSSDNRVNVVAPIIDSIISSPTFTVTKGTFRPALIGLLENLLSAERANNKSSSKIRSQRTNGRISQGIPPLTMEDNADSYNISIEKAKEQLKKEMDDAKEIYRNEGQVQGTGLVRQGGEGQGGQDIQLPTQERPEAGYAKGLGLRSGAEYLESLPGTPERGVEPSLAVEGTQTPSMAPTAFERLRGRLTGEKGRAVEEPKAEGKAKEPWEYTRDEWSKKAPEGYDQDAWDSFFTDKKLNSLTKELSEAIDEKPSREKDLRIGQIRDKIDTQLKKIGLPEEYGAYSDVVANRIAGDIRQAQSVRKAVKEGKKLRPEVLADYSDLKPPASVPVTGKGEALTEGDKVFYTIGPTGLKKEGRIAQVIAGGGYIVADPKDNRLYRLPYGSKVERIGGDQTGTPSIKTEVGLTSEGTQPSPLKISDLSPSASEKTTRNISPSTTKGLLRKSSEEEPRGEEPLTDITSPPSMPKVIRRLPPVKGKTQPWDTIDENIEAANRWKAPTEEKLKKIAKKLELTVELPGRVKSRESAERKARDKEKTPAEIGDWLGQTIAVDSMDDIQGVAAEIEKDFEVVKKDDLFGKPLYTGYKAVHYDIRHPDGFVSELQIHTKEGYRVKEASCWPLYSELREIKIPGYDPDAEKKLSRIRAIVNKLRELWGKVYGPIDVADMTKKQKTVIVRPGGQDNAVYDIMDIGQVKASHQPNNGFAKNPAYPKEFQERMYHSDPQEQAKVIRNADRYDPRFVISDNPDAINGPPIIYGNGTVLGGNSRVMSLDFIYEQRPETAKKYKTMLLEKADQFGVEKEEIKVMERPILVRRLTDLDADDSVQAKRLVRFYNQSFTGGFTKAAEAISKGRMIKESTLDRIAEKLADNDMSLRKLLDTAAGRDVIQWLEEDGVIEASQRAKFINPKTGTITDDGKDLIERAMLGKVISDADTLDSMSKATIATMERSIPALARIKARGGAWDILDPLMGALRKFSTFKAQDKFKSLKEFLGQGSMFAEVGEDIGDKGTVLLEHLDGWGQKKWQDAFDDYARAARQDVEGQSSLIPFETADEAFDRIFRGKVKEKAVAAPEPKVEGRQDGWRDNLIKARQVAKQLGLGTYGLDLGGLVEAIDKYDKAQVEDPSKQWDQGLTQAGRFEVAQKLGWSKKDSERLSKTKWGYLTPAAQTVLTRRKAEWMPLTPEAEAPTITPEGGEEGEGLRPLRKRGEKPSPANEAETVPEPQEVGETGRVPEGRPEPDERGDTGPAGPGVPGTRGGGSGVAEVRPAASGERPTGSDGIQPTDTGNYRITNADELEAGGPVAKFEKNVAAIKLLKKIESENRKATPEEQRILVKYTGWGGLSEYFKHYGYYDESPTKKRAQDLKELLTEEEYESAKGSTPNAHYTSPLVIGKIWDALKRYGFRGGRVLDPSMGIGHFYGLIPAEWQGKLKMVGIEIDSLSGRIAKQLYQGADVRIQGYEEAALPDGFFDVITSNVPFGDKQLADPRYDKFKFNIHDYFFAKSIDKLRPNGVIAFITSSGTMDKKDKRVRQYIQKRTELIGAIRLPSSAFKGIANTEVTTDIIFLRKLEQGEENKGPSWTETADYKVYGQDPVRVNEYFHKNPDNLLGKVYHDKLHPERAGLQLDGRDLETILTEAVERVIPENAFKHEKRKATEDAAPRDLVPVPSDLKVNALTKKDGKIYQKVRRPEGDFELIERKVSNDEKARIDGMLNLRGVVRDTLRKQLSVANDKDIQPDLKRLNKAYDAFVKQHGVIHDRKNRKAFEGDPDLPLLLALEKYNAETKQATKTDIFTKRVMSKYSPVERVESPQDALIATLFDKGSLDFEHMARISGKTEADLKESLAGLIYQNPEGGQWETSDEYLSGNVRKKLAAARAAAEIEPKYGANVAALEKVQPEDLKPSEISTKFGGAWIPSDVYTTFLEEEIGYRDITARFIPETGAWVLEKSDYARVDSSKTTKWSTKRRSAFDIFSKGINQQQPTVKKKKADEDGVKRIDRDATLAAINKLQEMKDRFSEWAWENPERAARLARAYNDEYNATRRRIFDGSHIDTLPGLAYGRNLHWYQKNAIWRIVRGGNALLSHSVGTGKTLTMTAAAMELKRIGLAKKPMFAVPKHLIGSWGKNFLKYYPAAKILVADEKDFTPARRKEFISRITTGEWDAVIVTYEQFGRLPMSKEAQVDFIREQMAELEAAIFAEQAEQEESGASRYGGKKKKSKTVKELENAKDRLETKLKRLMNLPRDDSVTFEELGVDYLFVDEAHNFKNLFFTTRMKRIAGVPTTNANRSNDMFLKTRWLTRMNGGRGIVFATGTPISNTMAEMFTMTRYLNHKALEDLNIHNFDAWASVFGDVVAGWEVTPTGAGFRQHSRFSKFVNLPELINIFTDTADVIGAEDAKLPIPTTKGGSVQVVASKRTEALGQYIDHLVERMEAIRGGQVDPREDNALAVTTDGRKAALDIRLVLPDQPDDPGSKVNQCVQNVVKVWKDTKANRLAQLVFCDLSKPDSTKFNVYDDVKKKLMEFGIPKKEIAFIHDADTDAKKVELFERVRNGEVRVLMGSTKKMGEGMNVQRKLYAIHHLDAPWRPSDIEQRNGRIYRQGNPQAEVEEFRYVTEESFDAYMWQTLEGKARFIASVMHNKAGARAAEDIESIVLSYAEVKALASGNPLIMEKIKADAALKKYEAIKKDFEDQRYHARFWLGQSEAFIEDVTKTINSLKKYANAIRNKDEYDIELEGNQYDKESRKDAGAHILKIVKEKLAIAPSEDEYTLVGSVMGLPIKAKNASTGMTRTVDFQIGEGGAETIDFPSPAAYENEETAVTGYIARITALSKRIRNDLEDRTKKLEEWQGQADKSKATLSQTFKYEKELEAAKAKVKEIDDTLGLNEPDPTQIVIEEDEGPSDEDQDGDVSLSVAESTAQFIWTVEDPETPAQVQALIDVADTIKRTIESVTPKEVLGITEVKLVPQIDIEGRNIAKALKDYGKDSISPEDILGTYQWRAMGPLIEVTYHPEAPLSETEEVAMEEALHMALDLVVPAEEKAYLLSQHDGNEEKAVKYGVKFILADQAETKRLMADKSVSARAKLIWKRIKDIFRKIRAALGFKGYRNQDDIWRKVMGKEYKPHFGGEKGAERTAFTYAGEKAKAETKYQVAGETVDGRTVRKGSVPNTDSIGAELTDYEVLPGIREVPMSDFELSGKTYSVDGNKRIAKLSEQIRESKEITPLIVVVDDEGSYILEGATRADALKRLDAKSFPALVVIDKSQPKDADGEVHLALREVDPIIREKFDVPEGSNVARAIKGALDPSKWTRDGAKAHLDRARTLTIDRYHPIEQLGRVPYQLHRMLGNSHLSLSTFLQHGKLSWNDGVLDVTTKDQGFLPWLHNLSDRSRDFFYWMAVKRAEKLEAEGRENWLDQAARDRILNDQVFKGLTPAQRAADERYFMGLNAEFQKWNRNILDIAREAGLLNQEQIDSFMKDFYLPFYRIMEDENQRDSFFSGPHKSKQHISAQIRRLKGGEEKLGDPITNILRNWSHLIQESQRNMARKAAAEVAVPMGLAEEVDKKELTKILGAKTTKRWAIKKVGASRAARTFDIEADARAAVKPGWEVVEQKTTSVMFGRKEDFHIVSYQRDGESVYIRVADQDLFEALAEVNSKAFNSGFLKVISGAKRLLTAGATFSPAFRIANLLRDTLHTAVVSKSFIPFVDSARGVVKVWRESPEYISLMASAGGFGKGWVESGDPKAMARSIEKIIEREGKGARGRILDTPRRLLDFWDKVGHASEMAARVMLAKNKEKAGASHLESVFAARDILDFHLSGASNAVRVINASVPFLNARVQGLDRLYRGARDNPIAFFVKGGLVTAASLMLWALFKDDDRYKELEDWDKWQYHHFWIGGLHFRIPKAFEVGAIFASLFESMANVLDGQEDWKFFRRFLAHTMTQTFAISPPAAFAPAIEVFANKSFFTGRPIENFALKKLPPGERSKAWTPEILKDLGKATNISPLKMEQILYGHTAMFGTMAVTAADAAYRFITDAPDRPAGRLRDLPITGRFMQGAGEGQSKYGTRFYEFASEVEELTALLNNYKALGDLDKAEKLIDEHEDKLQYSRFIGKVDRLLSNIRKEEKLVWADPKMTADEKRDRLNELQAEKNEAFRMAYDETHKGAK